MSVASPPSKKPSYSNHVGQGRGSDVLSDSELISSFCISAVVIIVVILIGWGPILLFVSGIYKLLFG